MTRLVPISFAFCLTCFGGRSGWWPAFTFVLIATVFAQGVSDVNAQAPLQVLYPLNDTAIASDRLTFGGAATPLPVDGPSPTVVVRNGTEKYEAKIEAGRWQSSKVPLDVGDNHFEVSFLGETEQIRVVRWLQTRQKYRFIWDSLVDDELTTIAQKTLNRNLSPTRLRWFKQRVRARTQVIFELIYDQLGVEKVKRGGTDVHTIHMTAGPGSFFGFTNPPFDDGNLHYSQHSYVSVGAFREAIVGSFNLWRPMDRGDTLGMRIEDIAHALARTAAHEFGHGLGLVGEKGSLLGGWMAGCDGWHNCPLGGQGRFGRGNFLMDKNTPEHLRIGEPVRGRRSRPPLYAPKFNNFNFSYLTVVLTF